MLSSNEVSGQSLRMEWEHQRCHSIVEDDIHLSAMYFRDERPPILDVSMMSVEQCEVQGSVTISRPWHIDEWTPSQIDSLATVNKVEK